MELTSLKDCYRIHHAWRDLGLPGEPGKICRSPFPAEHKNGDANPSFSIYDDGRRAKDFATAEHFDVFDFVRKARGCDMAEAVQFVQDRVGILQPERKPDAAKKTGAKVPPLRRGSEAELQLADDATLQPIQNFDWAEWSGSSSGGARREPKVREEHLRDIFGDGKNWLTQKRAKEELMERAGVGKSAAYDALKLEGGRFSNLLTKNADGLMGLRAVKPADNGEPD
ncbi:MAG: hypothetical protein WBN22_11450 [Verrucomicrobiia bacterium]